MHPFFKKLPWFMLGSHFPLGVHVMLLHCLLAVCLSVLQD